MRGGVKTRNSPDSSTAHHTVRGTIIIFFEQGVGTKGGVVLELDANVLGAFNQDVMSAPDKAGTRSNPEHRARRYGEIRYDLGFLVLDDGFWPACFRIYTFTA